jgi:hypothetical protein
MLAVDNHLLCGRLLKEEALLLQSIPIYLDTHSCHFRLNQPLAS